MDRVGDLLTKVLNKRGLKGTADAALIVHYATLWLSERIPLLMEAGELKVTTFKDGALTITSTHPIASQECVAVKDDLLKHLEKVGEGLKIREIRIVRA